MSKIAEKKAKKQAVEEEVNENTPRRRNLDRIKPLCDRAPDDRAHASVRVPENRRIVKGIFKNMECPGTMLTFSFRKYKEPITTYYLMDGATYDLPIEVVEHLNTNCGYKQHEWKLANNKAIANEMDKRGSNKTIKSIISRFAFTPTEYVTV